MGRGFLGEFEQMVLLAVLAAFLAALETRSRGTIYCPITPGLGDRPPDPARRYPALGSADRRFGHASRWK